MNGLTIDRALNIISIVFDNILPKSHFKIFKSYQERPNLLRTQTLLAFFYARSCVGLRITPQSLNDKQL
jgi:hypothetical protein